MVEDKAGIYSFRSSEIPHSSTDKSMYGFSSLILTLTSQNKSLTIMTLLSSRVSFVPHTHRCRCMRRTTDGASVTELADLPEAEGATINMSDSAFISNEADHRL